MGKRSISVETKSPSKEITASKYIAIDLGAESGRLMVGILQNNKVNLEEIYRFRTQGTLIIGDLHWNVMRFWEEIVEGLKKYHELHGADANGIGIDTWGVSIVGLDKYDQVRFFPFHYRADLIADPMLEKMKQAIGEKVIFDITGIQFMSLNTSTHLYAMVQKYPEMVKQCSTIFLMPDFFYYLLTGKKNTEYTNASTTQLLDAKARSWSQVLAKKIGFDAAQFAPLIQPGTVIGNLSKQVQDITHLNAIQVQAIATHDTASANAAIPHTDTSKPWAYLSSGTWSLLGVELPEPLISDKVREYNITNEGGVDGTIRFLKNIMGMWLLQQCKVEWDASGRSIDYGEIAKQAESAPANQSFLYPDDARFFSPKSMIKEIQGFCQDTKQPIPQSVGAIARCIFQSLACRYREVLEMITELTKIKPLQLHVVGGGSKNKLLNQMVADATQMEVIAGPVEATAIGNVLMQARGAGLVKNLSELREIVANSFSIESFKAGKPWDDGYKKYKLISKHF